MLQRYRSWLPKIFPIIILLILAFTYRDALRSMVLVPLVYLIFLFRLISASIGQQTLWISFVILSTIIAIISLAIRREAPNEVQAAEHKYPSRLQVWMEIVRRKEQSPYFQWNMARDLSDLFIAAIAHHDGISRKQVKQQLQLGKIDLPSDILEYLRISQEPFGQFETSSPPSSNWLKKFWENILKGITPNVNGSPLDIDNEKIIHYLEQILSVDAEIWES
jgi:hypothetical protein